MQWKIKETLKKIGLTKNELLICLIFLILGLILKAKFFFSTDLTWDEAFYTTLSSTIASQGIFPLFLLGVIFFGIIFLYLSLVKKNIKMVLLLFAVILFFRYVFNPKITFHPRYPPGYNILVATGIFLTNLSPEMISKGTSLISVLLMPFIAFFLAKKVFNKKTAVFAFILFALSPLELFYSNTALLNPLATMLSFASILLFFYGMDKTKYLPFAGIVYSLAISTRYTSLMLLPFFAAMIFLNKNKFSSMEQKNDLIIASATITAVILFFAPNILFSYQGFLEWDQVASNKLYIRDFEHYSQFFLNIFGNEPLTPSPIFYSILLLVFFSPLALLGIIYGMLSKKSVFLLLGLLFLAYFIFYSFQSHAQPMRYLLDFAYIYLFLGSYIINFEKFSLIIAGALIVWFLVLSVLIIYNHNFTELSKTLAVVPNGANIYTSYLDPTKYYAKTPGKIYYSGIDNIESIKKKIDVAIVDKFYFDLGKVIPKDFNKCAEIPSHNTILFWVFAKDCRWLNGT